MYIANAVIRVARIVGAATWPSSRTATSEPTAEVPTSAISDMRGTRKEAVTKDRKETNTNAQKQSPEITVVFRACPPLAPSARGGSERLAPAKIIATETPNQKSGGSKDEPTHPN